MKKISSALIGFGLTTIVSAQNLVTHIPPADNITGRTDTVFTVADAKTGLQYFETINTDKTAETGYILNGKKTGNNMRYFPNGVLLSVAQYNNGEKTGLYLECDKDGAVLKEENYLQGKLNGVVKIYTTTKNVRIVKSIYHYRNGILDGQQLEYSDMGKTTSEANYKNGKKDGVSKWYYANGQIAMEQSYTNDLIEGNYKTYNQEGMVTAKGQYSKGKKTGEWIEYHTKGYVKSQGVYKEDVKTGEWKYFDENGVLTKTENL